MTNWRSRSLLLACALGLGLAGCGDDDNTPNDGGGDGHVAHDGGDGGGPGDGGSDAGDGDVDPPDEAALRLAVLPFGFPQGQAFHMCLAANGGTTRIMASVQQTSPGEYVAAPLPVGTVTQHAFPASLAAQACGFPNATTCVAEIYAAEDVTLQVGVGNTPFCNLGAEVEALASVTITPTTLTGSDAYTVAFTGHAADDETLAINIFPDEVAPTDATKARVRFVSFDPAALPGAWELCYATDPTDPSTQIPAFGEAGSSVATSGNPLAARSAYVNIDPLAPTTVPDEDGGAPTVVPLIFTIHPPDPIGVTHCNPVPLGPDGIPVTAWPAMVSEELDFAPVYAGYAAGVASGGAMPTQSLAAGQVVTFYLFRSAIPVEPFETLLAIPLIDSPLTP